MEEEGCYIGWIFYRKGDAQRQFIKMRSLGGKVLRKKMQVKV